MKTSLATYRLLLMLLPPAFRREYAASMGATFAARLEEASRGPGRRRSGLAVARFVLRELSGGISCVAGEWLSSARGSLGTGHPPTTEAPRSRNLRPMNDFGQDLRYAARGLIKSPGFTLAAVLTLALGIGANAAVYSVVHSVVLRPLPYPDADRLVRVWPQDTFMKALFERFVETTDSYQSAAAFSGWNFTITGDGEPENISGATVSTNYFDVIGVRPERGRGFVGEDAAPGAPDVIVLSHGLWERRFGADPEIIGDRVQVGNEDSPTRIVVGIMPASYRPLREEFAVWTPFKIDRAADDYFNSWYLGAVGRLHSGVTTDAATDELRRVLDELGADESLNLFQKESLDVASVISLHEWLVGDVQPTLLMLLAAVALVLLASCTNVANLMLARASSRQHELAVRRALGAGRWRIVRQLFTEGLVLATLGGIAGTLGATWILNAFRVMLPNVPRADAIGINAPTLLFASGAAAAALLLFGLIPALRVTGNRAHANVANEARGMTVRGGRQHQALVAAEIAISCLLLVTAGLFVRSLQELRAVETGFDSSVVTMRVTAPYIRYPEQAQQRQFHRDVMDVVKGIPAVDSAGSIHLLPLALGNWSFPLLPQGFAAEAGQQLPDANFRVVTPGYFETMGIQLLRGRVFDANDRSDSAQVMVVNEEFAERFWPGEDPIGKTIGLFGSIPNTVIGVVGDVRQLRIDLPVYMGVYKPHGQWPLASMMLAVRSSLPPEAIAAAVKQAVWAIEPDAPVMGVRTMEEVVSTSLSEPRFAASLLSSFAILALALGMIGVYGVLSYFVGLRTREIGVRMALGAAQTSVLRAELSRGMAPVVVGIVIGMLAALASGRLLAGLLFEITATDTSIYVAVAVLLGGAALVASYIPARRAAKLEPIIALRDQ